jgi:hypothetical protein
MELILKEIQSQRNYEVEQINKNNSNSDNKYENTDWLKPIETSLKKNDKKIIKNEKNINLDNAYHNDNIDKKNKKNVTWHKNETQDIDEETNIFNKLKRVNSKENVLEERMLKLEKEMNVIVNKLDFIIDYITKNRII